MVPAGTSSAGADFSGWNFLFWGLWFAFFLILEKLFLGDILESVPKVFGRIYTLAVVLISWVFFALESPGEILAYLQAMFGMNGIGPVNSLAMFLCIGGMSSVGQQTGACFEKQ